MAARMYLLDRAEVSSQTEASIEEAFRMFGERHSGLRLLAWYHDSPLWYARETRQSGRARRIQVALVQLKGEPFLELTGDFQVRRAKTIKTPEEVRGPLVQYVGLDELTPQLLLGAMESTWEAVSTVDGRSRHTSKLTDIAISDAVAPTAERVQLAQQLSSLSARERQVLALLVEGADGPEIARRLDLSRNTVRTHVQSILTKLQVHSRLEAATLAIRGGLGPQSD
jgi:DNA-binding CsgD family transcriptional regulator